MKHDELAISRNIEIQNVECVLTKKISDKVFAVIFEDGTIRHFSKYTVDGDYIIQHLS